MPSARIAHVPSPLFQFRPTAILLGLGLALLFAQARPAGAQTVVKIVLTDEDGGVLPDVPVLLHALDSEGHLLSVAAAKNAKTNKKGVATYPFLPYNSQGEGLYRIEIKKDGFYIREFKFDSRQPRTSSDKGPGTMIQDHAGKLTPKKQGDLPALRAKPGGTATVTLVLAAIASEAAPSPAEGEAVAALGAALGAAAAAPADPLLAAKALAAQGKYDEAEAAIKALAAADPAAKYEFELARIYHNQDKTSEERLALLRVVTKDAAYPGANYLLGKLEYSEGRTAGAITYIESEIAAHPDDVTGQATLAKLYGESGRNSDAIRIYEALVVRDTSNADALVALGGLYSAQGDLKKSEETYKRVVAIDPSKADQVYYKVGSAISQQQELSEGERQRAADAFRKAIEVNPKHAKAHRELAYTLVGLGKSAEAKEQFRLYLELSPGATDAATIREFLKGL